MATCGDIYASRYNTLIMHRAEVRGSIKTVAEYLIENNFIEKNDRTSVNYWINTI